MKKYASKDEVEEKYKVNLNDYFKDDEDWEASLKELKKEIRELESLKDCFKDSETLKIFIDKLMDVVALDESLYVYANIKNDTDLSNSDAKERYNRICNIQNDLNQAICFFEPELLKLEKEKYEELISSECLEVYKSFLEDIYRNHDHILNESEESIVASLTNACNHYEEMNNTLINSEHDYGEIEVDGEKSKLLITNRRTFMKNKNRDIRLQARSQIFEKIGEYATTSASLLNSYCSMCSLLSKIRKFSSAWDERLFNLKMTDKVFDALISAYKKHLDLYQKYINIRKNILKLDKMTPADMSLDIVDNLKSYTIEEAQEICLKSIEVLGSDYVSHFKKIIDNHYIDYCVYPGKTSVQYSISPTDKDSRIIVNFNEDYDSVSTIIHEGGHNVHHQYIKENNNKAYRQVSSTICEIASLTNECLLANYMIENGSKEEKINALDNMIGTISNNFYDAIREGVMELQMYKHIEDGGSITKDYMNKLAEESLKEMYGDTVELDDYSKYSWVLRSHYYCFFYLFSYSICIAIATYVSKKISMGDEDMIERYKKFLSTGSSVAPLDVYKILGLDLEDEKTYDCLFEYINELLEKLEGVCNE